MTRPSPKQIAEARATLSEDRKARRKDRGDKLAKTNTGKASRGREIDAGFLAYLRRQPCEARHLSECAGPIESAHVRFSDAKAGSMNPGMQRKNHDRNANPLCRFHHQHDQHKRSERAFWASLGKDAYETAARHYATYRRPA
jgi:hypothetical protein